MTYIDIVCEKIDIIKYERDKKEKKLLEYCLIENITHLIKEKEIIKNRI